MRPFKLVPKCGNEPVEGIPDHNQSMLTRAFLGQNVGFVRSLDDVAIQIREPVLPESGACLVNRAPHQLALTGVSSDEPQIGKSGLGYFACELPTNPRHSTLPNIHDVIYVSVLHEIIKLVLTCDDAISIDTVIFEAPEDICL